MRVGVVVVSYGSSRLLESALLPLTADGGATAFVVDNWTDQFEHDRVAALCAEHDWRFLPSPSNVGFGAACNTGAAAALAEGCELLAFVNPDLHMTAATYERLVAEALQHPADITAPLVRRPDGSLWFDGGSLDVSTGRAHHQMPASGEADWLTGACLVMTSETFRRVGGFDPEYFLYWEDVDLTHRWTRLGGGLRVAANCTVVHDVGGTQDGEGKSWSYLYHNMRNRLLFARRNLESPAFARWLLASHHYVRHLARVAGVKQRRTPLLTFASGVTLGLAAGVTGVHSTGRN